ncbi:MAG: putative sulfate exporter family transporter [Bacteroidota bacterium]
MSKYLKHEDYWSIWIGGFCLLFGLLAFLFTFSPSLQQQHRELHAQMEVANQLAPFKTIAWYTAFDQQQSLKGSKQTIGQRFKQLTAKPGSWTNRPWEAFVLSTTAAEQKNAQHQTRYTQSQEREQQIKTIAQQAETKAAAAAWKDAALNQKAIQAIKTWRTSKSQLASAKKKTQQQAYNKWMGLLALFALLAALFGLGFSFLGTPIRAFLPGFAFVFIIGLLAYTLAGQSNMKAIGFGYAAWAIIIGLLISNTIGTPTWVQPALRTAFYIKTGLVLLGAEILFGKILAIGLPGIFVAWVVTPIVLVSTYWLGQRILKIPSKTLNITISADMSVCGVSAAVATAAACKASKEELTLAVGFSAWWLKKSSYNKAERPFIPRYSTSIMPDIALGYYFHRPDFNIALNYRGYDGTVNVYGAIQEVSRHSIALEVAKYVGDYHGFAPFVGPVLSYERLGFKETFNRIPMHNIKDNRLAYGLVFGWDIRPDRRQMFLLRTNLRWFPNLKIDVAEGQAMDLDNIEFNFIQLILFPNRIF